jgi:hypothetical protein
MNTARYVHWQDQGMWLGYFEEFPDYLTQGETVEELEENLRDLYRDLTSGEIPGIRFGRGAGFSLQQGLQSLIV